jgi:hypothetical protein
MGWFAVRWLLREEAEMRQRRAVLQPEVKAYLLGNAELPKFHKSRRTIEIQSIFERQVVNGSTLTTCVPVTPRPPSEFTSFSSLVFLFAQ